MAAACASRVLRGRGFLLRVVRSERVLKHTAEAERRPEKLCVTQQEAASDLRFLYDVAVF